jgi:hypothetical protein
MNEDLDDDGDGVNDTDDLCSTGMHWGWTSNATIDMDGDGCKDALEDEDDDGDGIDDAIDACPLGDIGWTSDGFTDVDGDGCRDISEDDDDDGDGVLDPQDGCPLTATNNVSDLDGDGCTDIIPEPETPFIEKFLQGDVSALAIVIIPLLILFSLGAVVFVRQGRANTERKLRGMIGVAETPQQLRKISNQAADMFVAKLITPQQHDEIQDLIRTQRDEFEEDEVEMADKTEQELARVFAKAVALDLTTKEAVTRMQRHVSSGRFSPEHYLEMWTKRIEDSDIVAAVDEEEARVEADGEDTEFSLSAPAGWPTSKKSSKPASKPSIASLNRMKKAELVTLAKEMGVSHSGTKAKIIDAIREEEE